MKTNNNSKNLLDKITNFMKTFVKAERQKYDIYKDAKIFEDAKLFEKTEIFEDAKLCEKEALANTDFFERLMDFINAIIKADHQKYKVFADAKLFETAKIYVDADAKVTENNELLEDKTAEIITKDSKK